MLRKLPSQAARKRVAPSVPQEAPQEEAPDDATRANPVAGPPDAPSGAREPSAVRAAVSDPSLIAVELLDGPGDGDIIACTPSFVIVGRDPRKEYPDAGLTAEQQQRVTLVAIASDPKLSRTHLLLTYREGAWYVRDLDSTNGTHIGANRRKLGQEEEPIAVGQLLRAGNSHLRLTTDPASAAQQPNADA